MVKNQLILLGLILSFSYSQDIKIMTYNIRYDNPNDGENSWENRKDIIINQIQYYDPDIIGTQEGLGHQIDYINNNLESFNYVGVSRADASEMGGGEYSAIFYNIDKYTELKNNTFWLSDTPDKPSRGWDASLNRICTYVLLKDNNSDITFFVFNTHFDHIGDKAREKSVELILEKIGSINRKNLPLFLIGDFNLTPDELPIRLIVKKLYDSKKISKGTPFGPDGTFNGFDIYKIHDKRIDYIFVSKNKIIVKKYAVLANIKWERFPSDHFPVFIQAKMK